MSGSGNECTLSFTTVSRLFDIWVVTKLVFVKKIIYKERTTSFQ